MLGVSIRDSHARCGVRADSGAVAQRARPHVFSRGVQARFQRARHVPEAR